MRLIEVENEVGLTRDKESNAIICKDTVGFLEYSNAKKRRVSLQTLESRINNIEDILKEILGKLNAK
jgi:hypothetical protein